MTYSKKTRKAKRGRKMIKSSKGINSTLKSRKENAYKRGWMIHFKLRELEKQEKKAVEESDLNKFMEIRGKIRELRKEEEKAIKEHLILDDALRSQTKRR